ncbi:MAG TPA: hypothetical protein VGN89_16620 [Phenylobacterium sp.]|nr:hypothetical protein [Phenylobacterium sp.]
MTPDKSKHDAPPPAKRRGSIPYVLFAGVAGACALGAGLGLWVRPAVSERQMAAAAPGDAVKPAARTRKLQIVVDDSPAPLGTPIEVLSAALAKAAPVVLPVPPREPEPQAPVRPLEGLMRVRSVVPPAPAPAPPKPVPASAKARAAPAPPIPPKIALARAAQARADAAEAAKAEARRVELAKAAKAEAHRGELAKAVKAEAHRIEFAKAAKAEAHRIEVARAKAEKLEQIRLATAKAEKLEQIRLAKAAAEKLEQLRLANAKAEKLEQFRLAKAKAQRQEQLRLAKAEAKGRAEARAEARVEALAQAQEEARRRIRLASLAHPPPRAAPHAPPHAAKPASSVELARLDRRPGRKARQEVQVERAAARKRPRVVQPAYRPRVVQPAPQPDASGLMRVSTSPRCANRDPGAAAVCADPALGAAERQLARAYQGARAAGVSDAQLQRQQQHWLASRSAAAREAPWAMRDVYLAHIAELNGMAKDAHGDSH